MRNIYLAAMALAFYGAIWAQHNAGHNGRVLMIASNPAVRQQTGRPIGTWYAEI